jgi:hypothetical protein
MDKKKAAVCLLLISICGCIGGNTPKERTPNVVNVESTIGYEHVGDSACTFEIFWACAPDYANLQQVLSRVVKYHGPHAPDVAEIVTNSLKNQRIHLKFSNVEKGDKILLNYTAHVRLYPERASTEDVASIPIPSSSVYPAEVQKYLNPGTGIEITDELTAYADTITSANTYHEVVCAIVREVHSYPLDNSRNEDYVGGTVVVKRFPDPYARTATQVYQDGTGACSELSRLVASLCRIKNVPCRTVSQFESGRITHTWNQVYIPGIWIDIDATTGKCPKQPVVLRGVPYLYIDQDENDEFVIEMTTSPGTECRALGDEELASLLEKEELWHTL